MILMNKFLKLGSFIVNPRAIKHIKIDNNVYHVNFIVPDLDGGILFGSGNFCTNSNYIKVCKEKSPESYKTLSEWINKVTLE